MFRSLTLYQLTSDLDAVLELMAKKPGLNAFQGCAKTAESSWGFVCPLGMHGDDLLYEANGGVLMCLRIDEKIIPPAAMKLALDEWEREQLAAGEEVTPVDRRTKREALAEGLLPTVIPSPRWTYAYIDKRRKLLLVGATDEGADEFISKLGKSLGGRIPVTLLGIERDPCEFFTEWVQDPDKLGEVFTLGDSCSLKQAKEGGTANIQVQHDDLQSHEIEEMLKAGKEVCRISLEHPDLSLTVTAKLGLRRITPSDGMKAETDEIEDPSAQRAEEFAVFVSAMGSVIDDLEGLLGGWPEQQTLGLETSA